MESNIKHKCPECGGLDITPRGKKYVVYPYGLVAAFGLILSMFHQGSLPYNYLCNACGAKFGRRSKAGGCYRILFIIGVVLLALTWLSIIFMMF